MNYISVTIITNFLLIDSGFIPRSIVATTQVNSNIVRPGVVLYSVRKTYKWQLIRYKWQLIRYKWQLIRYKWQLIPTGIITIMAVLTNLGS